MTGNSLGLLIGAFLALVAGPAQAQIVLDFTGGNAPFPQALQTLGWAFSLSQPHTISALGIWDEGSNGLFENHIIGIWPSTGGAPLAQTTVTNASMPIASTQVSGRWLFENLATPLSLLPGSYVIGADYVTINDVVRTGTATPSMSADFTFLSGRFVTTPTAAFDFPDASFATSGGHFGPNLFVTTVPEPSSLVFAASAGCLFVSAKLRRRKAEMAG